MKALPLYWPAFLIIMAVLWLGAPAAALALPDQEGSKPIPSSIAIHDWQMNWEHTTSGLTTHQAKSSPQWFQLNDSTPPPAIPEGVSSAWVRLQLPELSWDHNGLYIERLHAQNVRIYADQKLIYEAKRTHLYDGHRILLPLQPSQAGEEVLIWMDTATERLGLDIPIRVGDYEALMSNYVKSGLLDIILGCAFVFVAIVMMICLVFLQKDQFKRWLSLSLIVLTTGLMIVSYSPYLYTFYPELGVYAYNFFDVSLLILLPSLTYFFEKMMVGRRLGFVTKFRKFQVGFSIFCAISSLLNVLTDYNYYSLYYLVSVSILGVTMLVQLSMLFGCSVYFAFKGNKVALIFSTGFMSFAMMGIIDLILYYMSGGNYKLVLWKWGIVCFVISLIIILGRRFASDHKQLIAYSKELEMFNTRLQRSEKMEIISGLAASVAHEVRNPLQVTRGFLQLLRESSSDKDRHFMALAIEELDRASHIITDFLTFAKPELDEVSVLNIGLELKHIEGILRPLANLQGGSIRLDIPSQLYIEGNSSKLKQALINIIKNSIEALNGQGEITIWAYKEKNEIVVHIRDDGEGMNEAELAKLGEPYFSNKTKGTGLGLMVTFRIIEVMQGKLEFSSTKGVGTEAILRFPSVSASA
ncbi:sensor histidine kinase [Paenibacillus daejeonensis]|uniref:sensor histidine kinase n=1 Tax=Paenibacillus daejeonensis TaxID=135193 RepID=UPI00037AEE13|nr:HAMP domain-containing sensor histidine kinase [Paenibacillus daejeonensis]